MKVWSGQAQVWLRWITKAANSKTYPGNSQWLLEVLSPNQPESPGSRTLHDYPQRHTVKVVFKQNQLLNVFKDLSQSTSSLPTADWHVQWSVVRRFGSPGGGGGPSGYSWTNGFWSFHADKWEHKDRVLRWWITPRRACVWKSQSCNKKKN